MSNPVTRREWLWIGAAALVVLVVLPCLNAFVPVGSPFHVSNFTITVYGKYLCYAVLAMGVNLLWGYTGLLSLGQCLFFSLGGYALGMHLMLMIGNLGQYKADIPDFMVFLEFPKRYPETGGCRRTGYRSATSGLRWRRWCGCRRWWRWCSGSWHSARGSRGCIFRS